MSYNTKLESMIDAASQRWQHTEKKKMFGGVCYLIKGNMAFGIHKDSLIVRMDKDEADKSLGLRNIKPFAIIGRPMRGWVMVREAGWKTRVGLEKWLEKGKQFALSLPEKKAKAKKVKTLKEYKRAEH
jgi:TfoX/Sxy family transcriptional regulator of competence genes